MFPSDQRQWSTPSSGRGGVGIERLSDALSNMRANVWRLAPGASGRRHAERVQEELFVVLEGTATMFLGEPPERVALPQGSVAAVAPGTALQVRNESQAEAVVLIVGAPPDTSPAEYFEDVE
ncbi:MAG: cupin domain-containing protein [Gaiellaceae bacterium]